MKFSEENCLTAKHFKTQEEFFTPTKGFSFLPSVLFPNKKNRLQGKQQGEKANKNFRLNKRDRRASKDIYRLDRGEEKGESRWAS